MRWLGADRFGFVDVGDEVRTTLFRICRAREKICLQSLMISKVSTDAHDQFSRSSTFEIGVIDQLFPDM